MIGHKILGYEFLRHGYNSNLYQFFIHKSSIKSIHLNIIMKSRNTTLFEDVFPWKETQ